MSTASTAACAPFSTEQETVQEFLERFKVQCSEQLLKAGQNDRRKATILIKALPVSVITDLQRRIKPTLLSDATYDELEEKLTAQYEVKKSVVGAAVKFLNKKQSQDESIEDYAKSLNDLAAACKYNNCCRDRLLRDAFVSGLRSSVVLSAVLQKCDQKTFNECVEHAKLVEQLTCDAQDIKQECKTYAYKVNNQSVEKSALPPNYVCIRCGAKGKHSAKNCFANELQCRKCLRKGHIAKVCKGRKFQPQAASGTKRIALSRHDTNAAGCCHITSTEPMHAGRQCTRGSVATQRSNGCCQAANLPRPNTSSDVTTASSPECSCSTTVQDTHQRSCVTTCSDSETDNYPFLE